MKAALPREEKGPFPTRGITRDPLYQRLRPGPGHPREHVAANQRARLCGAMIELVAERGYRGVTVRELSRLAGVSTKTFYECFANVSACFTYTHSLSVRHALARTIAAGGAADVHRRFQALFAWLAEESKTAHLVLIEPFSVGPAASECGQRISRALERLVIDEFSELPRPVPIRPPIAYGVASGILAILRSQLGKPPEQLMLAADRLASWLVALRDERLASIDGLPTNRSRQRAATDSRLSIGDERRLVLAAVVKLAMADGYGGLTVPAIRREAGVARRVFDEHFEGVEDCFLAAVEARLNAATKRAEAEAVGAGTWERGVVRALVALAADFARDPFLARLGLIDVLAPGRAGLELRGTIIARWATRLRRSAPNGLAADELTAEASVAAAWGIAEAMTAAGRIGQIRGAVPSMAFILLAPVIGSEATAALIAAELYPN